VAVLGVWAVTGLALAAASGTAGLEEQFPELPPDVFARVEGLVSLFGVFSAVAGPFVWAGGVAALMHLATRPFGGGGSFRAMLAAVALACAPWAVAGAAQLLLAGAEAVIGSPATLGTVGFVVSAAALVWHVALVVTGGSRVSGLGYGRAAGSCALTAFGCATAALFLLITLAVLVVSLSR